MNIKLRKLAYGGFALVVMSQAVVGMENMNPNTMDSTTPLRKPLQATSDLSPPQNPERRVDSLPKADAAFGNFKFTIISSWYNLFSNKLVGLFTRHEAHKVMIRSFEGQVALLTAELDYKSKKINKLESDLLVAQNTISSKDILIKLLQAELDDVRVDKKALFERMDTGSRAGSYKSNTTGVVDDNMTTVTRRK
jgi:hypothetical protein